MSSSWSTWKYHSALLRCVLDRCGLLRTVYTRGHAKSMVDSLTEDNQYDRLANVVTPSHLRTYNGQLEMKDYLMRKALKKVYNIIKVNRDISVDVLDNAAEANDGQICQFIGVKPSPVVDGYRNKDSFCFGTDINGNSKTVGFPIGKLKDKNLVYIDTYQLRNICDHHKSIMKTVGEFIRLSPLPADSTFSGVWRSGMVRSTRTGETMVSMILNPNRLSEDEFEEAKNSLRHFFEIGPGRLAGVTSLHLQVCNGFTPRYFNSSYIHLAGSEFITEVINGKKFQIAPNSFFQINSSAAEVLFSTIGELLVEKSVTNLLDVCCGTGTIGILLSDYVENVYGVDVVPEAIECAKHNARMNDISNIYFTCSMAHRLLNQMVRDGHEVCNIDNISAIVNPGRVGLNKKFIRRIRNSATVKQVIYVSCKPTGNALRNIVDLIVPENEEIHGEAFVAEKAVAVDMFPHTRHCELIISLVR